MSLVEARLKLQRRDANALLAAMALLKCLWLVHFHSCNVEMPMRCLQPCPCLGHAHASALDDSWAFYCGCALAASRSMPDMTSSVGKVTCFEEHGMAIGSLGHRPGHNKGCHAFCLGWVSLSLLLCVHSLRTFRSRLCASRLLQTPAAGEESHLTGFA